MPSVWAALLAHVSKKGSGTALCASPSDWADGGVFSWPRLAPMEPYL